MFKSLFSLHDIRLIILSHEFILTGQVSIPMIIELKYVIFSDKFIIGVNTVK